MSPVIRSTPVRSTNVRSANGADRRWRERGQAILLGGATLAAAVAITFAGCASVKRDVPGGEPDAATGGGTGGRTSRPDGGGVRPDAPAPLDSNCVRTSCMPPGGQYCEEIGDNCGRSIICAACPGDQVCEKGLCVGGASCVPRTSCAVPGGGGGNYCGVINDGCQHTLACGDCADGTVCKGGLCVAPNCVPLTCNIAGGGKYCGMVGDGCGGTLDCTCDAPQTCGGTGIDHVCGDPACVPIQCNPMGGGQYCGDIGNGCGKALSCPAGCPNAVACPANHVCPGSTGTCIGLQCQIDKCTAGGKTTVSGTVYDPAGVNPLYNVVVYVPNQPLADIPSGATCDTCASPVSGQPVAAALTDATGHFTMTDVPSPAGQTIPLVVQIGKWRRQFMVGPINKCVDNPIPITTGTDKTLRLPKTQAEGHLPKIALATGHSDALDCLMRKIGIADSEFTPDSGTGRVHMYVGGAGQAARQGAKQLVSGAAFADAYTALYDNYNKLAGYDLLILQCEGSQISDAKTLPRLTTLRKYADNGGRVFNEHLHSYWIARGLPPWPSTAAWQQSIQPDLDTPIAATVNTTFVKGAALADWLQTVQATTTRGQLSLVMAQHSVDAVTPPTQAWITTAPPMASTQYLTFNTPVEAPASGQCGRVVFTDVHVGSGGGSSAPETPFPMGCAASLTMSAQEKALEFMFFDLSSCVQVDTSTPMTPPVPPLGGTTPPPNAIPPPAAPPPPPPPPPPPVP